MKKYLVFILTGLILLSIVACTGGKDPESEPMKQIRVILDYLPNTNHTGIYVADEMGYYADEGLEVEIMQPSEGATATLIATGQGEFGVSYQEDLTYARTAQDPLPVKAIATLVQHNTSGFASYKPKNILSPKDFEDKTYVGWGSPAEEAIVKVVMENYGGDFSKLTIASADDVSFAALKDKVDLTWIFYGWTGIEAESQDFPLNYIELREMDERLDYYTPILIASEKLLEERPELARKFLAATAKGYRDAIDDPDGASGILARAVPEYDKEFLRKSQHYLSPRYMEGTSRWGEMKKEVWDGYTGFLLENDLIPEDMLAEDAFTNEFLPK